MLIDTQDGERTITFHQSWINTFAKCPEQGRLQMLKLLPRKETDATAIGTSFHSGIEVLVTGGTDREAIDAAYAKFDELRELPEFEYVQVKTPTTARRIIFNALWGFYDHVLPTLGTTITVEQHFNLELARRGSTTLRLAGTWDLEDDEALHDWKTAGRPYESWEVERWYVQPTVYSWAHAQINGGEMPPFKYTIAIKSGTGRSEIQRLTVQRHQGHVQWLEAQLWAIVDLFDATASGARAWPLLDQGWHCSAKWCPVWHSCKGASLGVA